VPPDRRGAEPVVHERRIGEDELERDERSGGDPQAAVAGEHPDRERRPVEQAAVEQEGELAQGQHHDRRRLGDGVVLGAVVLQEEDDERRGADDQ
jgi:hypothetical protein